MWCGAVVCEMDCIVVEKWGVRVVERIDVVYPSAVAAVAVADTYPVRSAFLQARVGGQVSSSQACPATAE